MQSAELALESITEELIANHGAVSTAINYHGQLMDTLYKHMAAYPGDAGPVPGVDVFSKGFINPAAPVSGAWEAALATGVVENASYDKVRIISQVYETQAQYETQSSSIGEQIYSRMFENGTRGIVKNYHNLAQIVGSFFYTECGLAEEYARVVPLLKSDSTLLITPQACQYLPQR